MNTTRGFALPIILAIIAGIIVVGGLGWWIGTQNSTSAVTEQGTSTPSTDQATAPAATSKNAGQTPSATIDQNSLIATPSNPNPTITGTAQGLSSVSVHVSQVIVPDIGGGPYPFWAGTVIVQNGKWSFLPTNSNAEVGGGSLSGVYTVGVYAPNGTIPLAKGVLVVNSAGSTGSQTYASSKYGFSFQYPYNWVVDPVPTDDPVQYGATTIYGFEAADATGTGYEIRVLQFSSASATLPDAGCTATYSFSASSKQWMTTESGCDGAANTPVPYDIKSSSTASGLPIFRVQEGLGSVSYVIPLSTDFKTALQISELNYTGNTQADYSFMDSFKAVP